MADYVRAAVETAVRIHEEDLPGDILIFLTGAWRSLSTHPGVYLAVGLRTTWRGQLVAFHRQRLHDASKYWMACGALRLKSCGRNTMFMIWIAAEHGEQQHDSTCVCKSHLRRLPVAGCCELTNLTEDSTCESSA